VGSLKVETITLIIFMIKFIHFESR
jgi:hypothetical protein